MIVRMRYTRSRASRLHFLHRPVITEKPALGLQPSLYCRVCGRPIVPVVKWLGLYRRAGF